MEKHCKVVVIGAGVSGLVTMKTMKQLGIDCIVYEAGDYHGGLWHFNPNRYGVMEFTHINVSRYNYAFSDFPFPDEGPEFAHHTAISSYIDDYAEHFNLAPHIQYKTRVVSVQRSSGKGPYGDDGGQVNWLVYSEKDGSRFLTTCEYLVVGTGHHAKPKIPTFVGEDKFEGEIIHSVKYKDVHRSGYEGKNVVLIGIGNSAVDIADNLVTKGQCPIVHIASRSGAWVLPSYFFGSPGDLYLNRIGDSNSPNVADTFLSSLIKLHSGHPERWGLNPKYGPSRTHPTVSQTLVHHIQRGKVKVSPNLKALGKDYVEFDDGSIASDVKAIIKCTGYTIHLPFFEEEVKNKVVNEDTNELKLFHTVFSPEYGKSLALIGYIQPIGSLASMSEIQAQWLGMLIKGKCCLPSKNDMKERILKDKRKQFQYKKSTRHTIQRKVIPYCDEIASYFGAKPSVLKNPRLLFSSGGVAQWTLQGPYYNPKAKEYVASVPIPTASIVLSCTFNGIFLLILYKLVMALCYVLF
ncbi:flavin-containing monooxygenase 5-like [Watersipora subatra]|uniref:flavin-containing monooxygenase 5-like n=1 Tax=Watersipora subatra TaxID=2589382 RepID=UPI00355BAFEC